VLKGGRFLAGDVARLQMGTYGRTFTDWEINHGFHAGGYAKRSTDLEMFIADFADRHGILLDWIYAAKMMWGIFTLAEQGLFPPQSVIVAVI
jgi:1-aminocyclopropane-1-carboxylate deaminase